MHFLFETARRAVIKLGSGILTTQEGKIDQTRIGEICRQMDVLIRKGIQVIIVSSGAITLGMGRLGIKRRPTDMTTLQACAAVGQSILTDIWQTGFNPFSHNVAQILLTREDVRVRDRHVAVKDLFDKLLSEGIVPVVNENDSVSTEEIKFGENDVLSLACRQSYQSGYLNNPVRHTRTHRSRGHRKYRASRGIYHTGTRAPRRGHQKPYFRRRNAD